jgi:hypothetical protein
VRRLVVLVLLIAGVAAYREWRIRALEAELRANLPG